MSDSRPKSKRAEGDLCLSVIHRGFPHYTHRQIQRWAESGKIPGAYRLKRGHWRVRNCRAFRRWWGSHDAKCRLSWAIEGDTEQKRQQWVQRMVQNLPRDWVARLSKIKEEEPMIQRLYKVIGMHTHTGAQGYLDKNPHPYWWDTPDNELPRELVQWAQEATDETLDVVSAVEDLNVRGVPLSVKTVAAYLHISPATFYRRGYNRHFKMSLAFLREVSPPLQKDSLAEASALTWWLDPNLLDQNL